LIFQIINCIINKSIIINNNNMKKLIHKGQRGFITKLLRKPIITSLFQTKNPYYEYQILGERK